MSWRNSKAFETLTYRMLGLLAAATSGGITMLSLSKHQQDFGAPLPPCCCPPQSGHADTLAHSLARSAVPLDVERRGYVRGDGK